MTVAQMPGSADVRGRLRVLAEAAGFGSLPALAEALGVNRSTPLDWEVGRRGCSARYVHRLAAVLNVPVETLRPAPPRPLVPQTQPSSVVKAPLPLYVAWGVRVESEPVVVAASRTVTVRRAGECIEGDHCPRWHCDGCDQYWLGQAKDHRCATGKPVQYERPDEPSYVCSRCQELHPTHEFSTYRTRTGDVRRFVNCRTCRAIIQRNIRTRQLQARERAA